MPDPHGPDDADGYAGTERPRTGNTWTGVRIPRELIDGVLPRVRRVNPAAFGVDIPMDGT